MKRRALTPAIVAVIVVSLVGMFAARTRLDDQRGSRADTAKRDSVWYHESDVALVASTGRPQLVEFFHPD